MNAKLERKLKAAYPSGEIHDLCENALMTTDRDDRLTNALRFIAADTPLICTPDLIDKPAYEFAFTQLDHPEFNRWVWQMDNQAKLAWIQQVGEPYPVLWLKVSRVAEFFDYFFNLWTPRDETGYLDANWTYDPPNALWTSHLHIIRSTLTEYGFEHISDEFARSRVPFITEPDYDSVPDDDPRWDDDSFEPPAIASSFYRCTFGI